MNDDYAPRLDPGFAAWLHALAIQTGRPVAFVQIVEQRAQDERSLVNAEVSLIAEAEAITKDTAIVSLEEAAELHAQFNLPYVR